MFTVLHKWDGYTAHSMDQVAKYLYQYYDTQTTEKLCLLFNMLESNNTNDSNHSRWEADDRWIVHASDVADIEWPGEKRLKRKHNQINPEPAGINNNPPHVEEDEKRTKAKRWDTFSKFLARIGFLKSSAKKSMAWVCSWTDTSGIFNRHKLKTAAQNGLPSPSLSPVPSPPPASSSSSSTSSASASPSLALVSAPPPSNLHNVHLSPMLPPTPISIPNTPPSPQIPLSPSTPSSFISHNSFFPSPVPSPTPSSLLHSLANASDGVSMSYPSDSMPFSYNNLLSPNNPSNNIINLTIQTHYNNGNNNNNTNNGSNNNNNNNNYSTPQNNQDAFYSNMNSDSNNQESNAIFAPLNNSAEKVSPNFPPTFALSSYLRDISGNY